MTKYTLANMDKWSDKAKRNTAMVFRSSAQKLAEDVMEDVGSDMGQTPIDTGNLRNSLMASTAAMPPVREDGNWEEYDPSPELTLTIAGADVGDTLWLGFQAAYGARLNFGFTDTDSLGRSYNQTGRNFIESKANNWQQYVDAAARELGD